MYVGFETSHVDDFAIDPFVFGVSDVDLLAEVEFEVLGFAVHQQQELL